MPLYNLGYNFWLKSIICFLSSYLFAYFGIRQFISFINKRQICRQPIRQSGPETHLKTKKNTPTMGGVFIVLSTTLTTLLFLDLKNSYMVGDLPSDIEAGASAGCKTIFLGSNPSLKISPDFVANNHLEILKYISS